jgi:hypothetical protein
VVENALAELETPPTEPTEGISLDELRLAARSHARPLRPCANAGNVQPLEPVWNVGGYANNAVQRVPVTVVS